MGDALHVDGGVTSAQDARLADAGLLALQGPTPLDVRTGVLAGPGTLALVTGTASTAPMRYSIAPHQWVTSRGSAQGPYRGSLDAVQLVDTTAAPGSGSRIDLVYEKQQDAQPGIPSPDATTAPLYGVVQGVASAGTPAKPALPVGAIELAAVTVAAGATRTDGAGVTIANTARQTTTRGGILPVRATDTEAGAYAGQYRDHPTAGAQRWDGTRWVDQRNALIVQNYHIAGSQNWADGLIGAFDTTPRYQRFTDTWNNTAKTFKVPWAGEYRARLKLQMTGGVEQGVVAASINKNGTSRVNGAGLASDREYIWANETYLDVVFEGVLAAGDLLRCFGYSNTNPSFTSGTFGGQRGYFLLQYLGPTPVAT